MKERKPNRMKGYDYSSDNLYFVTSCVHNMECWFGEIIVGKISSVGTGRDLSLQSLIPRMILNDYGEIAQTQWYWLAEQYPYVLMHAFVVMPNHIHGIIEINRGKIVRTDLDLSIPKIKSLSELMGAYKTTVSKQIHLLDGDGICTDRSRPVRTNAEFSWHRSFYEHIIRNENTYKIISDYITDNPEKWNQDKYYNLLEKIV